MKTDVVHHLLLQKMQPDNLHTVFLYAQEEKSRASSTRRLKAALIFDEGHSAALRWRPSLTAARKERSPCLQAHSTY